jgi:crotonobetainyl-CoA:carnitine CoA-transferase CaiB-like acyl-CoA transferase
LSDPQVRENHILQEHESKEFGKVRQPRPAALFDRTPSAIRKLAPLLGADNEKILSELGYGAEDIERLKLNRVLHQQRQGKKHD